jgi:hypothetical protein
MREKPPLSPVVKALIVVIGATSLLLFGYGMGAPKDTEFPWWGWIILVAYLMAMSSSLAVEIERKRVAALIGSGNQSTEQHSDATRRSAAQKS